jgi:hypothetical protein
MADSVKATERLYLTADRERVVKEGDPDAAFLFSTPGKEISAEDAKRFGIKAASKPADKQAPAPENKASGVTIKRAK